MATAQGAISSAFGFPSQFQFQLRDGRRLESVIWSDCCSVKETHLLGRNKEVNDTARKLAIKGELSSDEAPKYVGFFEVCVARVRGMLDESANDVEIQCTPGVFDVEHAPEIGFASHAHIELVAGFLDAIRRQMKADGLPAGAGALSEKNGRQHAIHMLISVFELAGLTPVT